jgi:hypothetical protein
MKGLAYNYEKAINKELSSHAAWLPVTNTLKVGDYGYFEGGVFRAIGNLREKYPDINLNTTAGPAAKVNFSSEGTRTFKFDASGSTTNSFAALGDAEASLKFQFSKSNSIVIKADQIVVDQLQNMDEVALSLASKSDWRKKYKVVSAVYTGKDCLIVCAREAESEFTISASANILKDIEAGKANGAFETTSSNSSTFDSIGESGVLAIRLFKLNWLNKIKLLADDQISPDKIIIEEDFGADADDVPEDDY